MKASYRVHRFIPVQRRWLVPEIRFAVPDELLEAVAARAAELVAERSDNGDGWRRGASAIAAYIGAPRSRVYALATTTPPRIPVERDGSSLIARRSDLDSWIRHGGGLRP
jgi:hypothetical protein